MQDHRPKAIFLKDYQPANFLIPEIELHFNLDPVTTVVRSKLRIQRNPDGNQSSTLRLDGDDLRCLQVTVDERPLNSDEYTASPSELVIPNFPEQAVVEITTQINPQANTQLMGLYYVNNTFCTQCEAEGFRRITYFLDRPDVLSRYTVVLTGDKTQFPVLLANGNCVSKGETDNNKHWARWQDPFPKPCYLFACVAGNLDMLEDKFITVSDREVALQIFVEPGKTEQCHHAMHCLKTAMRWDEEKYGREYDLDIFMIVAISSFNMGAMENKGLNVFNDRYILADAATATDVDFANIASVVSHEYFHNWTGNRVTCRDWFQLSLKEGLTIFRDQEFSADFGSRGVSRIDEVNILRNYQFREDDGPLSHPVRPESYIEINNFYTTTVYRKGAEVVRMINQLLGDAGFHKGMDLYFQRHDGQAVTIEDFVAAMADANHYDFSQFKRWYSQPGTPTVKFTTTYDAKQQTFNLHAEQSYIGNKSQQKPVVIPIRIALIAQDGKAQPLCLEQESAASGKTEMTLTLTTSAQDFTFTKVSTKPVPSWFRGFSAPVKVLHDLTDGDLQHLLRYDNDPFARYEAAQEYAVRCVLTPAASKRDGLLNDFAYILQQPGDDLAMAARLLTLPSEHYIGQMMSPIDVDAIANSLRDIKNEFAAQQQALLTEKYQSLTKQDNASTMQLAMGHRALKNICLSYLSNLETEAVIALCFQQFTSATTMTDSIAALDALCQLECEKKVEALEQFYKRWQSNSLVIDKWYAVQAMSRLPATLQRVQTLMQQPAFDIKNPNRVRALIGSFVSNNPLRFHVETGAGYQFLGEFIQRYDAINPQVAASLTTPLTQWRRFNETRQALMKKQLKQILTVPKLSRDVYEIVEKSLV